MSVNLRPGEIRNLPPAGKPIVVRGEVWRGSDYPRLKDGVIVRRD